MELSAFWKLAIEQNWRMSWQAWQTLALSLCGFGVLDNDSPFKDSDVADAVAAHKGFSACTIGPGRHFKITVGKELRSSVWKA